ncbi:hypothetical protein DM01DRAFT_1408967 [Hesseltinella vesiculosa]|uniref:Cullin family profile domain-containing protein n=1 Tax=Hesseltinella vesiculosa TaxID=101127 RepID=A0A1X2GC57_9FUNG|nr:hypothetical protein DM01DRAFT_1408967 [Hesseltinella vesiculosa]
MLSNILLYNQNVNESSFIEAYLPPGLPSMEEIIEYCEKYPRLLTLRDSPLKDLQDPLVSIHVIHDWYTTLASKYFQSQSTKVFDNWQQDLQASNTDDERFDLLLKTVDRLYSVYDRVHLALSMPWTEASPMTDPELKRLLKTAFDQIVISRIPHSFYLLNNRYASTIYMQHFEWPEDAATTGDPDVVLPALPCTNQYPYQGAQLTWILTQRLDDDLPELVQGPTMTDDQLDVQVAHVMRGCTNMDVDTGGGSDAIGTRSRHSLTLLSSHDSLEESGAMSPPSKFAEYCQKANTVKLAPQWKSLAEEWLHRQINHGPLADDWTEYILASELRRMQLTILPWLSHILTVSPTNTERSPWHEFLRAKIQLEHSLYAIFYESRCNSIFDILMTNYPSACPVFEDLKTIESIIQPPKSLKKSVKESLDARLLYRGASATDIIQQYLGCIRYLKVFDPTCQTLLAIQQQVESYMITYRKDTIEGVVEMIRNRDEYDLNENSDSPYVFSDSEVDDSLAIPMDEISQLERLQRKCHDLLAMLISLCGSIPQFIEGYQTQLAQALLMNVDYDTLPEEETLEILKTHFPENTLFACEIMLKDMTESKRLDTQIHEANNSTSDFLHGIIMSRHYWPEAYRESAKEDFDKLSLLPSVEEYGQEFSNLKGGNRKLEWLPEYGSVTLELEFENRTQEWTVKPPAAIVIRLFEKCPTLSMKQIMTATNFDAETTMESLNFWYKCQVLTLDVEGFYTIVEN